MPKILYSSSWFRHKKLEKGTILWFCLFFLLYILASQVGVRFFVPPAVIFPAAGISLALLLIKGISLWPAIFLGSVVSLYINGASPFSILLLSTAQTFQGVLGYYFLKKLHFDPKFKHLKDTIIFMVVASSVSIIVPTFGMLAEHIDALVFATSIMQTWGSTFTGMIVSLFIITPLIVSWYFRRNLVWDRTHPLETFAAFALLVVILSAFFLFGISTILHVSMVYILLVPLFWIALRIDPRFMTLALFTVALFGMFGLFFGPTAPSIEQLGARVFQVEIFLNIISVIFLVLVVIEEERKETMKATKSHVYNLELALNKLSHDDRAKNQFIAVLAHELRNPLAPLLSSIELLKAKEVVSPENQETLSVMDDQVQRMKRLLEDLLDISRISRQKLILRKSSAYLSKIIEHSVSTAEPFIKQKEQSLTIDVSNEQILLEADEMRLEQVFINLLNNASKFTDKGGSISITVKRNKNSVLIHIKDSGIGIESDVLSKIFEPFLQVELGRTSNDGLGIGLSLTKTLVEMHGGVIQAKSEGVGKGSEFIVSLPYVSVTKGDLHSVPVSPSVITEPEVPLRVLVVDDNVMAANGIAALLKIKGHTVECAFDGKEAKEKTIGFKPDVVVLDIGLPDVDGYVVAQSMRNELHFNGSIIALTGYGQEEDKQRAFKAGFNFHLTKPVRISDLQTVLSTIHKV